MVNGHRTRRARHPAARPALLGALVLIGTVLAGCGGAQGDGVATAGAKGADRTKATASASKDPRQAMLEFTRCMRKNGVNLPDPARGDGTTTIDERDVDPQAMEAASKACRDKLPPGVGGHTAGKLDPQARAQLLKFARCMRQHGVNMPDPAADGGIVVKDGQDLAGSSDATVGVSPTDPKFKAAAQACNKYFGAAEGGPR